MSRFGPDLFPYSVLAGLLFLTCEGLRELAKRPCCKDGQKTIATKIGIPMSYILAASLGAAFGAAYWWIIQRVIQETQLVQTSPIVDSERFQEGDQVSRIEALLKNVSDPAYRQLVASVIHTFEPTADVAVGGLVNTTDGTRTVDVLVHSSDKLRKTAIDIVDLPGGRKAGVEFVDAAESKKADIKADIMLLCSNTGFDADAIRKAKRVKVGLITVLRQGDQRVKAVIEEVMYLRQVDLNPITFTYNGATERPPKNLQLHDLKYKGESLDGWLMHRAMQIVMENPASFSRLQAHFNLKAPTEFDLGTKRIMLNGFAIEFNSHVKWFSQTVQLNATTGIYDYVRGKLRYAGDLRAVSLSGIDIDNATPMSSPPELRDLEDLIPGEIDMRLTFWKPFPDVPYSHTIESLVRPEDLLNRIENKR